MFLLLRYVVLFTLVAENINVKSLLHLRNLAVHDVTSVNQALPGLK